MTEILYLKELINLIPLILNYVVPGYIFYSIIKFQFENKYKNDKYIIFKSVVLSYFVNGISSILVKKNCILFPIISIFISICMAIVYINIIDKNWFVNLLQKVNLYKTFRKDMISDIVDLKLGMWLCIYLKEEEVIYLGKLIHYEDVTEDNHRYMLLSCYSCYSYDGMKLVEHDEDNTNCVLLNIVNVDRIEIVYPEKSDKIRNAKEEPIK